MKSRAEIGLGNPNKMLSLFNLEQAKQIKEYVHID